MEQSDALRKAQNVLNLAADPSTSEAERENYQNIAFDIIEKFGIDEAMLNAKADVKKKPTRRSFDIIGAQAKYRIIAFNAIAYACRCHPLNQNFGSSYERNKRRAIVFGFESDLDILEMLWTSLQLQGFREVAKVKGEITYKFDSWETQKKVSTKAMRNSFWMGFGYRIAERLKEAEKGNSTPGTDLVLFDRSKEVDDAVGEAFPNRGTNSERVAVHQVGMAKGREAGDRANIHDKAEVSSNRRELA